MSDPLVAPWRARMQSGQKPIYSNRYRDEEDFIQ